MYEDSIPHYPTHYHHSAHSHDQPQRQQQEQDPDQELQRLHQHQLLIQLRLEVNSLRTQIQQLELLKQQLIHQRQFMQPAEYEQLMDQFSRTTASLLRVGHPSHFGDSATCQGRTIERGISGATSFGGSDGFGDSGGGGYTGMHMMARLQDRLRSMTLQQQHQQHQEYTHKQLHQSSSTSSSANQSGANSPKRDPVRMEQISLEAELRDLERRMRSIQLLR
ncbi:hypothetical protein BC939DRAFT_468530 [Gamsiella multidivaricata]|uniref:uncharacterized protein n=1 Tax=Gamsiella multidivaricata TaxID=101098 RepID=UPI00221EC8EC|nr:uncharacterized protein BC939DRAFT_468530 [Gamsiella multidivaricata]KAI7816586.1 hypothetical protein BC939DRAFT_468530 [Gamsiella multidivaricata]